MDGLRVAEAADVLGHGLLGDGGRALRPAADVPAQVVLGVGVDEALRQVIGLDEEEPVEIALGRLLGEVPVLVEGRQDVHEDDLGDGVGVVEGHAVGDARAAVVPDHGEAVEAELLHHPHLIRGHGALRVGRVVGRGLGLGAVAVAAQVGGDHGEGSGEARRHPVPHDVGLREAVEQEKGRARAAGHQVDGGVRQADLPVRESLEHVFSAGDRRETGER